MIDLKTRLTERLGKTEEEAERILAVVDKYNPNITVRNFDEHGLFFTDNSKRKVRVCDGNYREKMVHIQDPHADIAIIYADGMLVGWMESSKLQDIQDRMLVDTKVLNPMPDDFNFRKQCPHMEVYGGFVEDGYWECIGCGQKMVYNDSE